MVMVAESAVFHDRQAPMATLTVILLLGGRRRRAVRFRITAPVDEMRRLTFRQPAISRPHPYGRPITVPTDSDSICAARAGPASFQTTGLRQRHVRAALPMDGETL